MIVAFDQHRVHPGDGAALAVAGALDEVGQQREHRYFTKTAEKAG